MAEIFFSSDIADNVKGKVVVITGAAQHFAICDRLLFVVHKELAQQQSPCCMRKALMFISATWTKSRAIRWLVISSQAYRTVADRYISKSSTSATTTNNFSSSRHRMKREVMSILQSLALPS
ncbi:hypothetical protein LB503_011428 [Fusarium chuoi]|nr:hypothetical protein LB503_011428 [Fusarium chuoi]